MTQRFPAARGPRRDAVAGFATMRAARRAGNDRVAPDMRPPTFLYATLLG